jgi:RNA polymerase sigma-70 factor, ECF subfamily
VRGTVVPLIASVDNIFARFSRKNFAKSLTHNADEADDLVQETLLRGVENVESFQPGTNMEAWLVTILRNLFLTGCRRRRHEQAYKSSLRTQRSSAYPRQYSTIQLGELQKSLGSVPGSYREALLLVFAYGYSYDEAADVRVSPWDHQIASKSRSFATL